MRRGKRMLSKGSAPSWGKGHLVTWAGKKSKGVRTGMVNGTKEGKEMR